MALKANLIKVSSASKQQNIHPQATDLYLLTAVHFGLNLSAFVHDSCKRLTH